MVGRCAWQGGMHGGGMHGGVCVSGGMHGGGTCVAGGMCVGACMVGGERGGACMPWQIAWAWDTVNERAVHILLEYNLVSR